MSMIFTHITRAGKQTYEGFCFFRKTRNDNVIGLVPVEDYADIYILDENNVELAVDELKRMYRMEHGIDVDVIVYAKFNKGE